jgi:NAD(P)-dependent dehydrogenase (short-subunit alcohol dehydrogenase family)
MDPKAKPLQGQVAVVAGATRGAGRGIACMLGEAGATVYCTGRSVRGRPSPMARPEVLEDTAEMVRAHGGVGVAVRVDHTAAEEVEALFAQVKSEHGRLDILVNDIWGGDPMIDWSSRFWEMDVAPARALIDQAVLSHVVTARFAAPLMVQQGRGLIVEVTDGAFAGYRGQILYDFVKSSVIRLGYALAWDLRGAGVTALSITPGFLRSEAVLEHFGVTEANWRDAAKSDPLFGESETPYFVGRAIAALAADPNVGRKAGLALTSGGLAEEYGFDDVDGRRPNIERRFDQAAEEMLSRSGELDGETRFFLYAVYLHHHRDPARRAFAQRLADRLGMDDLPEGLAPA